MAKQSWMTRIPVAAALVAVLLAACGGASTTTKTTGIVPVTPSTSTTTAVTTSTPPPTTTTTPPATTTTTTSPGTPPCRTADFALTFLGQEGATGHGELGFALRNTSGQTCHTYGYPGILFLDKAGNALPTHTTRTTVDFFGNAPETALVVAPGDSVSFRLGVSHGAASPSGCTTVYGLQVIAPDDTVTTRTTIPQGAYECGGGATVSPLQPGDTAFAH